MMGFVGRGRWNGTIRAAVFSSLAGLLLIAAPGGAFAQTATQEQYVTQDQYSGGDVQQAPVGPEDPAYPGLTTPAPPSAPPGGATGQDSAAQDQYSGGGAEPAAPSPVPPAGPPRAPEAAPEDPASPGPASPVPEGAGPSQVPVGPGDPAHPGLSSQPPQQTFGQTLTDVSADLGGIGQGLAALNQGAASTTAASDPYSAAVPAFSAPTTAVVGGASPGQAPVAAVDPYSAAIDAVSAVGTGAPGYTTTASSQAPQGVAVLGGFPQYQQAPVAVMDPLSAAVGAVSPSVPGQTVQVAEVLQQMLTMRELLLAAPQQPPSPDDAFAAHVVALNKPYEDQTFAGLWAALGASRAGGGSAEATGPAPPNSMVYEMRCTGSPFPAPDTPPTMGDSSLTPTTLGVPDEPGSSIMPTGDTIRSCRTPINGLPPESPYAP